jgi:hypothetical protein
MKYKSTKRTILSCIGPRESASLKPELYIMRSKLAQLSNEKTLSWRSKLLLRAVQYSAVQCSIHTSLSTMTKIQFQKQ